MKNITIFFLAFVAFLLFSCKKDYVTAFNQNRVYLQLFVDYDTDSNTTNVSVNFYKLRPDGSVGRLLQLQSNSSILCNGQTLSPVTSFYDSTYIRYEHSFSQKVDTLTFVYTALNGDIFTNTAYLKPIALPVFADTIERNQVYDIPWTGPALTATEGFRFSLSEGLYNGYDTYESLGYSSPPDTIELRGEYLNLFQSNNYDLRLLRSDAFELQEAPNGGFLYVVYTSNSVPIYLR